MVIAQPGVAAAGGFADHQPEGKPAIGGKDGFIVDMNGAVTFIRQLQFAVKTADGIAGQAVDVGIDEVGGCGGCRVGNRRYGSFQQVAFIFVEVVADGQHADDGAKNGDGFHGLCVCRADVGHKTQQQEGGAGGSGCQTLEGKENGAAAGCGFGQVGQSGFGHGVDKIGNRRGGFFFDLCLNFLVKGVGHRSKSSLLSNCASIFLARKSCWRMVDGGASSIAAICPVE